MKITHTVKRFHIIGAFSLDDFIPHVENIKYRNSPIKLAEWRQYSGVCLMYPSGKAVCHGRDTDKYYKHLSEQGYHLSSISIVCQSAFHKLQNKVHYPTLVTELGFLYEGELSNAASKHIGKLHFLVHHSGAIIITGLRSEADEDTAYDFILQLELYS